MVRSQVPKIRVVRRWKHVNSVFLAVPSIPIWPVFFGGEVVGIYSNPVAGVRETAADQCLCLSGHDFAVVSIPAQSDP